MAATMSPKDRLLAAIARQPVTPVPCSFMIYGAQRKRARDAFDYVEQQLAAGLDAFVELPLRQPGGSHATSNNYDLYGPPVLFGPDVKVKDLIERPANEADPVLHRTYETPAGTLTTAVHKTTDWIAGDRVPLFDDYIVPRSVKRLVTGPKDLPALRHLLKPPGGAVTAAFLAEAESARAFAARKGVLLVAEWGVLYDACVWLCGMEEMAMFCAEEPEFAEELFAIVGEWNHARLKLLLEGKPDLVVRRAWYETVDSLSPATYRKLILPWIKKDADLVHQAGAKLGNITSSQYTPLHDAHLESGMDVFIGLDPVQDARADFALTKKKIGGTIALWGGVNGCVTVETGTEAQVREAVRKAIEVLAPGGGFILSPVDNVREDNPTVRRNVAAFIAAWKEFGGAT